MTSYEFAGLVLFLVAIFGCINRRYLRLSDPVGCMAVGLAASTLVLLAGVVNESFHQRVQHFLSDIDFSDVVFHGLLGLLLFAGSLQADTGRLLRQRAVIFLLASAGVVLSMFTVGYAFHLILGWLGHDIRLTYCLMFGALIAPTDPLAVIGVLKKSAVPATLAARITGESLFNDAVSVVAFLVLLGCASGASHPSVEGVGLLLIREGVGGVALGLALGLGLIHLIREIDSHPVEILATLAVSTGGFALAEYLHVSAPLAVVVAGLIVGDKGAKTAMSDRTRTHLFAFWRLIDEILNLVLFGLIGLELLMLPFKGTSLLAGLSAIPVVLAARWLSVAAPMAWSPARRQTSPAALLVLTWGGLRGGVSVALALALPHFPGRTTLIVATYCVVVFSVLVQATTLDRLISRLYGRAAQGTGPAADDPPELATGTGKQLELFGR